MQSRKASNPQDRRTRYTRQAIKAAMLRLMEKKPYSRLTVTEICKAAEINRGTFYLHYYDVEDVLDDLLNDAFSETTSVLDHVLCPNHSSCTYPLCDRIQGSATYRPLFLDDSVAGKIIEKISGDYKERFIAHLMAHSQLTYPEAEAVFYFQINGCLTINRMMLKNRCTDWQTIQYTIDRFLKAGLEALLDGPQSH